MTLPAGSVSPAVLAAVAVGGAAGAAARYGIAVAWPVAADGPPWPTLVTNLVGCALIGVLMRVVTAHPRPHRLLRPLLGAALLGGIAGTGTALDSPLARLFATGLCGALTTYSTFAYEVVQLAGGSTRDRWRAAAYAAATLVVGFAALVAVHAAAAALVGRPTPG